jgi:hypothetical protein
VQTTLHQLELLHQAIGQHQRNTGELPRDLMHLGIVARLHASRVPIHQGVPVDAWGNGYIYHLVDADSRPPYQIYSTGKNGTDESGDGDDVVSRSTLDVQFYPELYKPVLQLFPILLVVVLVPIVWAVVRAAKRAAL